MRAAMLKAKMYVLLDMIVLNNPKAGVGALELRQIFGCVVVGFLGNQTFLFL